MADIDLQYIDEVEPELGILIRKALEFKKSDYGKTVSDKVDELERDSEKETVSLLCMNEIDKAKTAAALAAACQYIRGVLWEDILTEGRNITSLKEGEE